MRGGVLSQVRCRVRRSLRLLPLCVVLALLPAAFASVAGAEVVDVGATDTIGDREPAQGPSPELRSVRLTSDTADAVTLRIVTEEEDADKALRAWADLDLDGAADVEFRGAVVSGAYSLQAFAIAGADLDCTGGTTTSFGPAVAGTATDAQPGTEYAARLDLSDTLSGPYDKATGFRYAPRVVAAGLAGPASTTVGDVAPDGAALLAAGTDFACANVGGPGLAIGLGAGAWQLQFGGFDAEAIDSGGAVGSSDVERLDVQAGADQGATGAYLARVDYGATIGGRIYESFTVAGVPTVRMTRLVAAGAGRTRAIVSEPRALAPAGCIPGDGWTTAVDLELPTTATAVVGVYLRTPDNADPASFRYAATAENAGGADVVPDLAGVAPGGTSGFCGPGNLDPRSLNLDLDRGLRRDDSAPTAQITPPSPVLPGPNTFSGAASTPGTRASGGDAVVSWDWFVGGETSPSGSGPDALLTIPAGTTAVRLRVTDAGGQVDDATIGVTARNLPPVVAEITQAPLAPLMGDAVRFTTSATDPEGVAGLTYAWDWGDGTTTPASTLTTASHVFPRTTEPAEYTVTVTVTETGVAEPASATRSRAVRVGTPTQITIADPGPTFVAGQPIVLTAAVTGSDSPYQVSWDLDGASPLDFTDQVTENVASGGTATATVSTLAVGTHVLHASAKGRTIFQRATTSIAVSVVDPRGTPPVARYVELQEAQPVPKAEVVLDASGSRPGSSGLPISALHWDFDGDGKADATTGTGNPSTKTVRRAFTGSGIFDVGLVAVDVTGLPSARYAVPGGIVVPPAEVDGVRDDNAPVPTIAFKGPVYRNVPVTLEARVANLRDTTGKLDPTVEPEYRWTVPEAVNDGQGSGRTYRKVFRSIGRRTVSLRVVDSYGRAGIASAEVDIVAAPGSPPTARLRAPDSAAIRQSGGQALVELDASASSSAVSNDKSLTYLWDLDGDGTYTERKGEARVRHGFRTAGRHNVGVQVTDAQGQSAVQRAFVEVDVDTDCIDGTYRTIVDGPIKASGCFVDQPFDGSGDDHMYIALTGRVMVNGVTFSARANPAAAERKNFTATQRNACTATGCRRALEEAFETGALWLDTKHRIFGTTTPYRVEIPLTPTAIPKSTGRTYRVSYRDKTQVTFDNTTDDKQATNDLLGFKLAGFNQLTFKQVKDKRISLWTAGITLPGLADIPGLTAMTELPNDISVEISEEGEAKLDGLSFTIGEFPLEFLNFASITVTYDQAEDLWTGEGFMKLSGATFASGGKKALPTAQGGTEQTVDDLGIRIAVSFQDGRFKSIFGRVQGINFPVGSGVFLQRIGLGLEVDPLTFKGDVRLTAGKPLPIGRGIARAIQKQVKESGYLQSFVKNLGNKVLDDVEFAPLTAHAAIEFRLPGRRTLGLPPPTCPDIECEDLEYTFDAPLSVRVDGNLLVVVLPFADAHAEFFAGKPVFFRFGGGIDVDVVVARLQARLAGWVYGTKFNLGGKLQLTVPALFDVKVQAVASNDGVAACGKISKNISGGISIPFKKRSKVKLFDGCNLAPYKTPLDLAPLTGGATGAVVTRAATARPRVAGAAAYPLSGFTLSLPPNTPQAAIRLAGDGAPPSIRLEGPDGRRIEVSAAGGVYNDNEVGLQDNVNNETVITVAAPAPGRWTVTGLPGSAEITSVETSGLLPEPKVKASVTTSRTKSTLRWSSTGVADGVSLEFSEQGPGASKPIATTTKRSGTVVFTPSPNGLRRREVYVAISRDGMPLATQRLAAFTAPKPPRIHRVKRLRATRRGHTVLLRFAPPKGGLPLSALELVVRTGRIRGAVRLAPDRTSYRVPFVDRGTPFRARIRGVGLTGRRGPRTTVRLPARRR